MSVLYRLEHDSADTGRAHSSLFKAKLIVLKYNKLFIAIVPAVKMEVKYNIVLLLAIAVITIYCVSANCPIDPKGPVNIPYILIDTLYNTYLTFLQSICIVAKLQMRRDKISLVLV